ncbi:MAG: D-alanyl-D-alanine carboxypeptidase family protein [Chloroflexi bacterium]|nr:D-alanyl-D-alanine carboxypeptidase family protein [Chloroflexota bacterium]
MHLPTRLSSCAVLLSVLCLALLTACVADSGAGDAATASATTSPVPTAALTSTATSLPARTATTPPAPTATTPPAPTATARPGASVPPTSGYPPEVVQGDPSTPLVALTFDSGSVAGETAKVLDILARHRVRTSWFITGKFAEQNLALVRRAAQEGHEVFNHSYSHPDLTTLSDAQIVEEMTKAEEILRGITGTSSKPFMRMPFGARNPRVLKVVGDLGYRSIYWTLDSGDWREGWTPQMVQDRVLSNVSNGSIVVHHSSPVTTSESLDTIIRTLTERGYQIVTVTALLGQSGGAAGGGGPGEVADGSDLLALVNKQTALPASYAPADLQDLAAAGIPTLYQGLRLRAVAVPALDRLMTAAKADGVQLVVLSSYRSYQEQQAIYQREVAAQGRVQAERLVARPGHSQHQLGTTVDFTARSVNFDLTETFGDTREGRWLLQNAHRFGFVLSYPKGKEEVTGYAYEPWHYRFIGVEAAVDLQRRGITLEEYLVSRR